MILKVFSSIGSYKSDNIEESRLQRYRVKALYLKREVKHIPIQILFCPQSAHGYYHIRFWYQLKRSAGPYNIIYNYKIFVFLNYNNLCCFMDIKNLSSKQICEAQKHFK